MKRILLLLLTSFVLLTFSQVVHAEEPQLQIWLSDGQTVSIKLNEEPVTTYSDGQLIIKTTKTTITYPLEQVKKYTYTHLADGVSTLPSMKISFSVNGETLFFNGLNPDTRIAVYSASGQLVRSLNAGQQKNVKVSVSNLPTGVYVVKVNGATYKITKR